MRNAKRLTVGMLAGLAMFVGASAHATILTFDTDQTGYSGMDDNAAATIPAGYGGFTWDNMFLAHRDLVPGSGYDNGTVSGNYTAYSGFGDPGGMSVVNPSVFDFTGVYMTAAWNTGLLVEVEGYLDGNLVGTDSIRVDTTGPTWWQVDLLGIDELVFRSSGGVDVGDDGGAGTHFAMDNFTYNETNAPVPEPATMTLLGLGLAGLVARNRKSRKQV